MKLDRATPRLILGHALLLATLTVVALSGSAAEALQASTSKSCAPPRGPGDKAVHSTGLQVGSISCPVGRKVALACTRFTYGHRGVCSAVGYRWHCTSTHPPG